MGDLADDFDQRVECERIEIEPYIPPVIKCKFCGKEGLKWHQKRNGKWILTSQKGTPHNCKERLTGFVKIRK